MDNHKRNFILNSLGLGLNQLIPIFLMLIIKILSNLSDVGLFSTAYYISQIIFIIGVFGGRNYQISENKYESSVLFYCRLITVMMMFVFALIFVFANNYSYEFVKVLLMCILFRGVEAVSDFFYGIAQRNNQLYLVGISQSLRSVLSIILFIITYKIFKNLLLSTTMIFITYTLILILFDVKYCMIEYNKPIKNEIFSVLRKQVSIFLTNFLFIINMNVTRYILSITSSLESQAIFNLLIQITSIILLISTFIYQPSLTKLLSFEIKSDFDSQKALIYKIILLIFGVSIFSSIILYLFGFNIVQVVLDINISEYSTPIIIATFISAFGGTTYLLNSVLVLKGANNLQLIIFAVSCTLSGVASYYLISSSGSIGAIYGQSLAMIVPSILLFALLTYKFTKKK